MRFMARAVKGAPGLALELEARVRRLPGILSARANPLTGSLLVEHDGAPERRSSVLAALHAIDRSGRSPQIARGLSGAADAVVGEIMDRLIERALHAAVAAAV